MLAWVSPETTREPAREEAGRRYQFENGLSNGGWTRKRGLRVDGEGELRGVGEAGGGSSCGDGDGVGAGHGGGQRVDERSASSQSKGSHGEGGKQNEIEDGEAAPAASGESGEEAGGREHKREVDGKLRRGDRAIESVPAGDGDGAEIERGGGGCEIGRAHV